VVITTSFRPSPSMSPIATASGQEVPNRKACGGDKV
jgi:hypothetical protein